MALRQAGIIFRAEASAGLVIAARAQESLRIRRIHVTNPSVSTQFVTLVSDTARVGFFRSNGFGGRHLIAPNETARGDNLLDFMTRYLGFPGYPVAGGEQFQVLPNTGTADIFVVADVADLGDNVQTQPNGSKGNDLTFVNYGTNSAAIAAAGYVKVDGSNNGPEFARFPFGVVGAGLVPAQRRATVQMIGGQAVGRFNAAGVNASTTYLRIRKGSPPGETLFDRADVGYPFFGTVPGAGVDYTSVRQNLPSSEAVTSQRGLRPDDVIPPTIELGPNDELALQVGVALTGAGSLSIGDVDVWVVERLVQIA